MFTVLEMNNERVFLLLFFGPDQGLYPGPRQ